MEELDEDDEDDEYRRRRRARDRELSELELESEPEAESDSEEELFLLFLPLLFALFASSSLFFLSSSLAARILSATPLPEVLNSSGVSTLGLSRPIAPISSCLVRDGRGT